MGWFRRNDAGDGDDFYRGDAPVLMPGADGNAPTAYVSGSSPSTSAPSGGVWAAPPPGSSPPDGAWPDSPPNAGWVPPADWQPPSPHGAPPGAVGGYFPATQHAGPGSTERTVRRVGLSCFVIVAFFVLLSIAGVALAFFALVRSAAPDSPLGAPAAAVGVVDVPLTVRYDDTDLQITIAGAQSQPGAGWRSPAAAATPHLVIAATIQPTAATSGRTTIPFVYWTFTPDDGSPAVTLDIISGFEPSIVTATFGAEEAESGYLAFESSSATGTLSLKDGYGDPPVASWELTATASGPVTGSTGVPVQAQIGKPPFTVTLAASSRADVSSEDARQPPATGSYLIADLTITSTGAEPSGIIDQELFVFVPVGGQPLTPVGAGAVTGTTSITSVSGGSSTGFRVAFDAPVGAGTLELRDNAGRTMIQWPVE